MERVWTIDWLKKVFLFGVDLTNDAGEFFPDEMWVQALRDSKQWLATQLDIQLPKATVTERKDFTPAQWREFAMMQLPRRPVQRVNKVTLNFGAGKIMDIPPEWVQMFHAESGQVQLVPTAGVTSSWPLQAMSYMRNWSLLTYSEVPGLYEVEYVAGYDIPFEELTDFSTDGMWIPPRDITFNGKLRFKVPTMPTGKSAKFKITGTKIGGTVPETEELTVAGLAIGYSVAGWTTVTKVEALTGTGLAVPVGNVDIQGNFLDETNADSYFAAPSDLIGLGGKYASCYQLNVAGDLIAGAGIASRSASIDGVSTSVGTTSSATNSGYGSRIIQYRKDIDKELPLIKRRYHGMPLGVA